MYSNSEQKRLYDAACKQVLSEKGIIAYILKTCVAEYHDIAIEDVRDKYICGVPEVGTSLVEGTNTESATIAEGTVKYDIRFTAKIPAEDSFIELIINIEAQNNFHPGYPLHKRATYYCSRIISSQYGTVFTKSHYEKIKKVYSIWVCTNPAKEWEYTINRYGINEEQLVGNAKANVLDYDLLTYVMVCLGHKSYQELTGLLRMLNYVMLDSDGFEAKRSKLLEEFAIEMTPHLEKGVASMCNLSEGIEKRGMEKAKTTTALAMLKDSEPIERIVRYSQLSIERVREIAQENGFVIA